MQKVNVAVGTLGRIIQLVKEKAMDLEKIEIFVMDEADKLMG